MAQRVSGVTKGSSVTKASSQSRTARSSVASGGERAITLELESLLKPYKNYGRLSLRVERLPDLARLSAGRNNGDNSWSLASDDLENLTYTPPDELKDAHVLAIRVYDVGGGSTLALLDYPISPNLADQSGGHVEPLGHVSTAEAGENPQIKLLREELERVKARLAAREGDLEKARSEIELSEADSSEQVVDPDITLGRSARRSDVDETRFASLTANLLVRKSDVPISAIAPQRDIPQNRTSEQTTEVSIANFFARKGEARPSLIAPPSLEIIGGTYRESVTPMSYATGTSGIEPGSPPEPGTDSHSQFFEQNQYLANEDLGARLAEAEDCVEERIQEAQMRWEQSSAAALAKAEAIWKANEAARLAAAEIQWKKQSDDALAELTAQCRRAEATLADANARATKLTAHEQDHEIELRRLHHELAQMRAVLAEREIALAQTDLSIERARERWQQASDAALKKAEILWKEQETARLAAAEAQWQKQSASALAALTARCQRAETALQEASERADTFASHDRNHEIELQRVRAEFAKLQIAISERDKALAQANEWNAQEAGRLAEAKSAWKEQSQSALAELAARCERAEKSLAQAETQSKEFSTRDRQHEEEVSRLRNELAQLQTAVSERSKALAEAQDRNASESVRIAEAQDKWKKQSTLVLAELTARCERAERSLAEANTRATETARREQRDGENLRHLQNELATLRSAVAERDQALAQAKDWTAAEPVRFAEADAKWKEHYSRALAELEKRCEQAERSLADANARAGDIATHDRKSREDLRRVQDELALVQATLAERETFFAEAELARAANESAKLAAAEAKGKLKSAEAIAELSTRCENAELSLAETITRAGKLAAREQENRLELRRLHDELAVMQATVAEREKLLAQAQTALENTRAEALHEAKETLAKAEAEWRAGEEARLAAAEAQWREQSGSTSTDLAARFERTEQSLAEANARVERFTELDQRNKIEIRRLRDELAIMQNALANREAELACARSASLQSSESQAPDAKIVLTTNRLRDVRGFRAAMATEPQEKRISGRLIRDVVLATIFGVSAIVFFPQIETYASKIGNLWGQPAQNKESAKPAPAQLPEKILTRAANVRIGPSGTAEIVSSLKIGDKVLAGEQQGSWTRIQFKKDGKPAGDGWVYSSFLETAKPIAAKPQPAKKK